MRNPSEPSGSWESRRDENGAPKEPGVSAGTRRAQPWGVAFMLFPLGFVALIVLGKVNLAHGIADVLRVLAAALCVSAFLIARRVRKPAR